MPRTACYKTAFTMVGIGILLGWSPVRADQSLRLSAPNTLSFALPSQTPYSSLRSFRLEMRIHDWTRPAQTANVLRLPTGFQVRFMGTAYNAPLAITDGMDTFPQGQSNTVYFDISKTQDFIIRVQRDAAARVFRAEFWNGDGTGYLTRTLPIDSLSTASFVGTGTLGGAQAACSIAYIRWFSTILAAGSAPAPLPDADLADWEFSGNLNDSSSAPVNLQSATAAVFVNSPGYPPLVSQGVQRVLRAGVPQKLDGGASHSLSTAQPLAFKWEQVSGPTALAWDSKTSATPSVTGLAFGSYQIKLTVTDSTGQSSNCTLKYGAVNANARDAVTPGDPNISTLFGPMLRLGANPWPYYDARHQGMADFFGGLQATDYADIWNVALPGVISVQKGSTTVTGENTSFRSKFCSGASTPDGSGIVIWYPVAGTSGHWGRREYSVKACPSDTTLTLSRAYATSDSASGLKYARMDSTAVGAWINGSSNANYYDNVMAFYSLYYRSGLDDYLGYARTLADRWWTMPWIDEGRTCSDGDGTTCLFPRVRSVTGLVARALDGRPDMWPGLRLFMDYDYTSRLKSSKIGDLREDAYATTFLSLGALFDPDLNSRSKYQGEVGDVLGKHWAPNQSKDGGWTSLSYGYATWNGYTGSVTVTNGSTVVTGNGTQWQAGWFSGNAFWTANQDGSAGDATSYVAAYVSPTQLTLNKPYQGPSAEGRAWQANNLVGVGVEPFMLGVAATAFRLAYTATQDSRARQFVVDIANWISAHGVRSSTRGLWYGRTFPNCEPIADGNPWCGADVPADSRGLAGTVVNAYCWAYLLSNNTSILSAGDNIYGAMYGKSGGPDTDSIYIPSIDAGNWDEQTKKAKDFGFYFGYSLDACWPAARLGPDILTQVSK